MSLPDQLRSYLNDQLPSALEMLQRMVTTNSFTDNKEGVDALGRMTAAEFARLGFAAEFVPAANKSFGNHLVLTRQGSGNRVIGCLSHLDTVFSAEEEIANNFRWRVAEVDGETWIHGPGTVDIKGGTVMIFLVLSALKEHRPDLFEQITWKILLNSAEERLQPDFGTLCRSELDPQQTAACLVFEGGAFRENRFKLVTQRKGRGEYVIRVTGRSAHAGGSHARGANAVIQLAEIARAIAGLTDYKRNLTFNVGTFHGGTVVNRVPHQATARIEFRTFDPGTFREAQISMQSIMGYSTVASYSDGFPCETHVERINVVQPWPQNETTDQLYRIWETTAADLGQATLTEARGGLSDGNWVWDHVPTLDGLGPSGGWAHSSETAADGSKEQEFIVVDSIVPKAVLNVLGIIQLINS
ncbi:MAG: M20/M25/M40 family metallo-hydrolase [Ardenticatenaceae bacterium]|nr:M20/M25/M40 family metallo-hydrolase [Ardenticatenaceae bacterium]